MGNKPKCSQEGCHAFAHGDSLMCTFHDPQYQDRIAQARARGGHNQAKSIGIDVQPPKTVEEIAAFLGVIAAAVARGKCSEQKAMAMQRLASLQLRALGVRGLDTLRDIESKLGVDNASGKTEETDARAETKSHCISTAAA